LIFMFLAMVLLSLTNCGKDQLPGQNENQDEKPVIAVTIVPEKTFAEAVCGNLAEVVCLVPPGFSPENYDPTPKEMAAFGKAKLYFAVGVAAEETNIMPKAETLQGLKIIRLQDEVAAVYPEVEIGAGERDPHIWLSPKRVQIMVQTMAREMGILDPDHKQVYEDNARRYLAELTLLDKEIQEALQDVKNRKFIVFHPAYGYLAADYGLEMFALEAEGKEATPARLVEMIELAKREQIRVIFYQAEISSRQAQAFADEIGGQTIQLEPLSPDYVENLREMAALMAREMR